MSSNYLKLMLASMMLSIRNSLPILKGQKIKLNAPARKLVGAPLKGRRKRNSNTRIPNRTIWGKCYFRWRY